MDAPNTNRWRSQKYFEQLSEHAREISPLRKRLPPRRLSMEVSIESQNLQIYGENRRFQDEPKKKNQIHIEPFKIKDYIPHINAQIRTQLSRQNKKGRIGNSQGKLVPVQPGDQKFFDTLVQQYHFDPNQFVRRPDTKANILYLQTKEEKDEIVKKNIQQFYRTMHRKSASIPEEPIDKLIISKSEFTIDRLPRFKSKLQSLKQ